MRSKLSRASFRVITSPHQSATATVATTNVDYLVEGEQALWRAVITQALMDAGSRSTKMEAKLHRRRAIAWFTRRNKELHTVCSLAGFDVEYVLEKAREAISKRCEWRKA